MQLLRLVRISAHSNKKIIEVSSLKEAVTIMKGNDQVKQDLKKEGVFHLVFYTLEMYNKERDDWEPWEESDEDGTYHDPIVYFDYKLKGLVNENNI